MNNLLKKLKFLKLGHRRKTFGYAQIILQLLHGLHADNGRGDGQRPRIAQSLLIKLRQPSEPNDLHADDRHSFFIRFR